MGLTQMQVRQCQFDWAFSHSMLQSILSTNRYWRSIARSTRSIAILSVSFPFFSFCSWSWTLHLNLRSIASALRPNAHSYISVKGQGSGQAEKESLLAPNVSLMPHLNIYKDKQALTCLLDFLFYFLWKDQNFFFLLSVSSKRFLQSQ